MSARLPLAMLVLAAAATLPACSTPMMRVAYRRPPTQKVPENIKSVGVVSFKVAENADAEGGVGDRVQSKIEGALIKNASYTVITRDQLSTLLQERQLSASDFAAGGQKDLKIEGVDALIVGTVTKAVVRDEVGPVRTLVMDVIAVGPVHKRTQVLRDTMARYVMVDLAVSVKMIDAKNGRILAFGDFARTYDSRSAETWRGGQTYATPPEKLTSGGAKLEELITAGADEFLSQICYHQVEREVRLISRGQDSERGVKFAVRGLIEEALASFEAAMRSEQPNDHALYDKGVMLEILGRYEEAFQAFKQAYTMAEEDVYLDAMTRMKEEKSFTPPAEDVGE